MVLGAAYGEVFRLGLPDSALAGREQRPVAAADAWPAR